MTTTSTATIVASPIALFPPHFRPIRIIGALVLLASALLAGCGFLKLTYNSAPELIYRWLDGYAGFNEEQTRRVRAQIGRLHQWHRDDELLRYAQLLERLARLAPEPLSAETACSVFIEARERFDALLREAEPAIVMIAADFRPEQFRHLERKFANANDKYRKKWIDVPPRKRMDERFERAVERAERFYGKLDEPQLAVIRARLEAGSFDPRTAHAESKRRQRDTLDTLRTISGSSMTPDAMRTTVHGWIERMQRSPDPLHRAYQQKIVQESCADTAALHDSTTIAQRTHAAQRLESHARDFRDLGDSR